MADGNLDKGQRVSSYSFLPTGQEGVVDIILVRRWNEKSDLFKMGIHPA